MSNCEEALTEIVDINVTNMKRVIFFWVKITPAVDIYSTFPT